MSRLLSVSTHLHPSFSAQAFPTLPSAAHLKFKGNSWSTNTQGCFSLYIPQNNGGNFSCAVHMSAGAGESGDSEKTNLDQIMVRARKVWKTVPLAVNAFPWDRAIDNFVQLILDLVLAVVKYLSIPLLAVSSLSEMSYCAHERKLFLVPFPFLIGVAIARVFKETALELSPLLKNAEVPWHLIANTIFFTLLKLPGPYLPYWGRIFIPHLANGGLVGTLWFTFLWYQAFPKALRRTSRWNSLGCDGSEMND